MTQFRIYGDALGEPDTFIDCTVDKQQSPILQREVTLAETDGDRAWTMAVSRLETLQGQQLAARHSVLTHPTHSVWGRLEGLRSDLQSAPFDDDALEDDVKELFQLVIQKMTANE